MKNLEIIEIRAEAVKGATLQACKKEAAMLALTEDRTVVFEFNGEEYSVSPEIIMSTYDWVGSGVENG